MTRRRVNVQTQRIKTADYTDCKGREAAMIDNEALHYLDNAATTRVAPEVADAIYKTMTNHWGNPSSLYTPGMESKELLDKARNIVGRTLGAEPGQVFFTGCGSESNNIALLGAALARRS